jgi:hypothetical protein
MIKAILVFNNHGKPRMSKFYQFFVSEGYRLYKEKKILTSISQVYIILNLTFTCHVQLHVFNSCLLFFCCLKICHCWIHIYRQLAEMGWWGNSLSNLLYWWPLGLALYKILFTFLASSILVLLRTGVNWEPTDWWLSGRSGPIKFWHSRSRIRQSGLISLPAT